MTSNPSTAPQTTVQEFAIRCPKTANKKHCLMRFNGQLIMDFQQWRNVRLERENSGSTQRVEEEMPKFGAGSEFNREGREEMRRKKFGIPARRNIKPDTKPWILRVGGKGGRKYKGVREGGVSENASFYVFTHAPDGAIEAYPLNEWYNFQAIQRYKSLSAEEAEHEFSRRKKQINFFSLMYRKRLKCDEDQEAAGETKPVGGPGTKKSKELKISEMDEWIDSDDDSGSDSDAETKKKDDDSDNEGKKKGKKKGAKNRKEGKKKKDLDGEAFEESDDGDEEGREMDYDTESSEEEPDPEAKVDKDMKSVAEEDALRKLLTSDEEEEEEKKSDESDKEDEEKKKKEKDGKDGKEKKKTKKLEKKDSSTDFSSDSSDSEEEAPKKKPKDILKSNANKSRSATPIAFNESNKRKGQSMPSDLNGLESGDVPTALQPKRHKADIAPTMPSTFSGVMLSGSKDDCGITEEAVRRYLMRKPMTATELLTKFKNKKTGVSSDRLVDTMMQILKRINPHRQTVQGKMYLSIKLNN